MRALYGETTAWKALMNCEAVYIKDVKTAFGANGTQIGFFFAETPTTPTWSPNAGDAILTAGEKNLSCGTAGKGDAAESFSEHK